MATLFIEPVVGRASDPLNRGELVELDFNAQPFAIHDETFVLQNMVSEGVLKPAKSSRLDG